jgi:hypothetical protein
VCDGTKGPSPRRLRRNQRGGSTPLGVRCEGLTSVSLLRRVRQYSAKGAFKCHAHSKLGMGVGTGGLGHFSDPPSATPIPYLEWG